MSRATHDRTDMHIGIENDFFELLSAPIGSLPAGTDLHVALAYIHNLILIRETTTTRLQMVPANAVIKRTYAFSITADARITAVVSFTGSFTANAIAKRVVSGTFTADAIKRRTSSASWTGDAWINLIGVHGASFTADSLIRSALSTLQWRSFDQTVTDSNVLPDPQMIRRYRTEKFR